MPNFTVDQNGWIQPAEHLPSPNCNDRPCESEISLLVIHNISLPPGEYNNSCIERFFCNQLDHGAHPFFQEIKGVQVSAHLLIKRSGQVIQFVPISRRAWHAGVSCFQGREACNDYSIGIELEGTDTDPYTEGQYECLVHLTKAIVQAYPEITLDRIVGHSDIAPGRKSDPGQAFDWKKYKQALSVLVLE